MSRVLMIYGTTDGHTIKIAEAIAQTLNQAGHFAEVVEAKDAAPEQSPENYDAVIVAGSVHAGGYQREIKSWVRLHARQLSHLPNAFVSVCLGVLEKRPETDAELQKILAQFYQKTGWQPSTTQQVAGAIPYTRYGFFKKWIMKRIAAKAGGGTDTTRDYEYTDWAALDRFVLQFIKDVKPVQVRA